MSSPSEPAQVVEPVTQSSAPDASGSPASNQPQPVMGQPAVGQPVHPAQPVQGYAQPPMVIAYPATAFGGADERPAVWCLEGSKCMYVLCGIFATLNLIFLITIAISSDLSEAVPLVSLLVNLFSLGVFAYGLYAATRYNLPTAKIFFYLVVADFLIAFVLGLVSIGRAASYKESESDAEGGEQSKTSLLLGAIIFFILSVVLNGLVVFIARQYRQIHLDLSGNAAPTTVQVVQQPPMYMQPPGQPGHLIDPPGMPRNGQTEWNPELGRHV